MSSSTQPEGAKARGGSKPELVTLPPNVTIYTGKSGEQLLNAKLFTRLETTVQDPAQLSAALGSDCAAFCVQHHNVAVIFDDADQDLHHEHFRQVCLKLKNHDLGLEYARCVFDAGGSLQAGFQLDRLNEKSVLVIDLQNQDNDDDDEDDDEDVDLASLGIMVGAGALEASEGSK